jgi:hypothetical protein
MNEFVSKYGTATASKLILCAASRLRPDRDAALKRELETLAQNLEIALSEFQRNV